MLNWRDEIDVKQKLERKHEKLLVNIYEDVNSASIEIANIIAGLISEKEKAGEHFVLGLATGSSPVSVYRELVRKHREEGLSFRRVITFNLDEYFPMNAGNDQSYVHFMHDHLFDHIDILPENVNIPDGEIDQDDVYSFCQEYEQKIKDAGGLDLQVLGIGRSGHIGFNEPGSANNSPTRLISLDSLTIADAAGDFGVAANVPRRAITMGIETILSARKIIFMAWGEKKTAVVKETVEGEVSDLVPATYIQEHRDITVFLDQAASSKLTRVDTPWLVRDVLWDDLLIKKAVVWLSKKLDKPILKLTNQDYNDNHLSTIITNHGSAYDINLRVFKMFQKSITGWPGGKRDADESKSPERSLPYPKTILVFSPRPADDVIAMGGTLNRLVKQGHEVHIAYQTSGNISVPDDEVIKHIELIMGLTSGQNVSDIDLKGIKEILNEKEPGEADGKDVRRIKSLIRKSEALASCRFLGIPESNVHFLEMPFYETGTIKKASLKEEDVEQLVKVLRLVKPNQVFAAGDLTDPHGTRRTCLVALTKSLEKVEGDEWYGDCWTWLYKGAWQEWEISDIDMAVPLSPEELAQKRLSIFRHSTQKDIQFPGIEDMEVWRYSVERNRATAEILNRLGMAEYEAVEVFVSHTS